MQDKKLLGSLRNLWRSSCGKGHDERITHLKSLLLVSPTRSRPQQAEAEQPAPVDNVSEPENVESEHADDSSEDERDVVSEGDVGVSDDGGVNDGDASPVKSDKDDVESSQSSSALHAPTLRLDDCAGSGSEVEVSSEEEEEPFPDSQVPGAGWMGRAIMAHNKVHREQEKEDQQRRDRATAIIEDIRFGLKCSMEDDDDDSDLSCWGEYKNFCFEALMEHGEDVFFKLAEKTFYHKWLQEQKAEPAKDGVNMYHGVQNGIAGFSWNARCLHGILSMHCKNLQLCTETCSGWNAVPCRKHFWHYRLFVRFSGFSVSQDSSAAFAAATDSMEAGLSCWLQNHFVYTVITYF